MNGNLKALIIFLLCLALITSCTSNTVNITEKVSDESTEAANDEYPVHYDISIGYWDIEELEGESDPVLEFIEDKFNISVAAISVGWNNYLDKYLMWSATGSLPDVFAANTTQNSTYKTWASQGIIRQLPEDMENYPSLLYALTLPDTSLLAIDGGYYAIPRLNFVDEDLSFSDVGLLVRRDWMETLGISDPQTFEEFTSMLISFNQDDPDRDGLNNTDGLSVNNRYALGKWIILTLHADCNTYSWVQRDGQYIPSYMTEDFLDIISALDYMYESGALDSDFAIQQTNEATKKFAQGKLGALEYKSSPSSLILVEEMWEEYQPDKDFTECVSLLNVFAALDGQTYSNTSKSYWSESLISAAVDDGKMDRILSLYEYLLSDEGMKLVKYGIEGQDYETDGDEISILRDSSEESDLQYEAIENVYPSINLFGTLASWGGSVMDFQPNTINYLTYGEDIITMCYNSMQWNLENTVAINRPSEFLTLLAAENSDFPESRIIDDMTRVILSDDDPAEAWEEVLESYRQEGIQELITRMNELAMEYGLE